MYTQCNKIMAKDNKDTFKNLFEYIHSHIQRINDSKIFAGLMIIIINIVSKYTSIGLSKTMESYLKYTFSRQLLMFSIAWMGTRDIYIAFFATIMFTLFTDYLFNEDSALCILTDDFREYHTALNTESTQITENVTNDEIKKAKEVLAKAKEQNKDSTEIEGFSMK